MKIAGVFGRMGPQEPGTYVRLMCRAQIACKWHSQDLFPFEAGAIGIVRTSERYGEIPMIYHAAGGGFVAVAGVPTKSGRLRKTLARVVEVSVGEALNELAALDGAYAALYWNPHEKKLGLVTDFMGFQPVYICRGPHGVAIASEIKAFAAAGLVPPKADPAGWGAFALFGHTLGAPTQLAGVERLRGVRLCYEPERNHLSVERHWEWPERRPDTRLEDLSVGPILEMLKREIAAYQEYGVKEHSLLMSSGFDSRLLLCLLTDMNVPLRTLSVIQPRHYFRAEGRLGYRAARHFNVADSELVRPLGKRRGTIGDLRYLMMNDVSTPGRSLFISKVAAHIGERAGGVWEGFAPGYSITQLTAVSMDAYLRQKSVSATSGVWKKAELVFKRGFVEEMKQRLFEEVEKERKLYGEDDYGVMRFIFRNRALNRTAANPLMVYANSVIPFMPGLSREFWNHMAAIPPLVLGYDKRYFFRRIFKEHFPRACRIPFCSEHGVYTLDSRYSPLIAAINAFYAISYRWERRHRLPVVGKYLKKTRNSVVDDLRVLDGIAPKVHDEEEIIDSESIRDMTRRDEIDARERNALSLYYYWTLWNRVMGGSLSWDKLDREAIADNAVGAFGVTHE